MSMRPIEDAQTAGLRGSLNALRRAAQRARVLAVQTSTKLIVRPDDASERTEAKSIIVSKVKDDSKRHVSKP